MNSKLIWMLGMESCWIGWFDGDLFRRLIEKVKVMSMVEVVLVFKSGVEVMEVLEIN